MKEMVQFHWAGNAVDKANEEIPEVEGDPNNDYGWSIVGGDRDKLIMSISKMAGSKGYTLLLDLNDNLKATVLWASE